MDLSKIKLPPLSLAAAKIMQIDPNLPEISSVEIETIITPDQGICAELLRIANSSYYGRGGSVKILKDAVTLLGVKTIKNLVIMLSMKNIFHGLKNEYFQKYIQKHSVLTGIISRDLAIHLGELSMVDTAFIAGLLQNIGMTIFAIQYKDRYAWLLQKSEMNHLPIAHYENEKYQTNHLEIGKAVFEMWKLPDPFLEIMIPIHNESISKLSKLAKIVFVSSQISKEMLKLYVSDEENFLKKEVLKTLNFSNECSTIFNSEYFLKIKDDQIYRTAFLH